MAMLALPATLFGILPASNLSGDSGYELLEAIATARRMRSAVIVGKTFHVDNSRGPLVINNATGKLIFVNGSEIVCDSLRFGCVEFEHASDLVIDGLTATFRERRTVRNGAQLLAINHSYRVTVSRANLHNGNSSALHMGDCRKCSVFQCKMYDMLANGFFGTNVQDLRVEGLTGFNLGDAVFEVSAYDSVTGECDQITANDIAASDSAGGILINGCRHVEVRRFRLRHLTNGSGAEVTQDPLTSRTQFPDEVKLVDGEINGVSMHGLDIGINDHPDHPLNLCFENIRIRGPGLDGVNVITKGPFLNVSLRNVSVSGAKRIAFRLYGNIVNMNHAVAFRSGSYEVLIASNTFSMTHALVYDTTEIDNAKCCAVVIDTEGTVDIAGLKVISPTLGGALVDRRPSARHTIQIDVALVKANRTSGGYRGRRPAHASKSEFGLLRFAAGIATAELSALWRGSWACEAMDVDTLDPIAVSLLQSRLVAASTSASTAAYQCSPIMN